MSIKLMTTLLAKANTGEDMLKVLEALTEDTQSDTNPDTYGTLEVQTFWWVDILGGQKLMDLSNTLSGYRYSSWGGAYRVSPQKQ